MSKKSGWHDEYKLPHSVKKTDISYAAGLIDGEGCIFINRQAGGKHGRINPSHRLYVKVTMGHEETVNWLKSTFQVGSVQPQKHGRYNLAWQWLVAAKEAAAVLRVFRPFLRAKAEEADIAFEFADSYWQRGSSYRLPPEVVALREDLYWRLREAKPSHRFHKNKRKKKP